VALKLSGRWVVWHTLEFVIMHRGSPWGVFPSDPSASRFEHMNLTPSPYPLPIKGRGILAQHAKVPMRVKGQMRPQKNLSSRG